MDRPGNLLVRLSSRKRRTLEHYREVEHAISAGGFQFVASPTFITTEAAFVSRRKKKVQQDRGCYDCTLTNALEV